jgi:hypothetical protein
MDEAPKDRLSNIEVYAVLKEFEEVFKEIPGLPPKRDIDPPKINIFIFVC